MGNQMSLNRISRAIVEYLHDKMWVHQTYDSELAEVPKPGNAEDDSV